MDIHVINLARRPDRLAGIGDALGRLGLDWRRVEAIDAQAEGDALRASFAKAWVSRDFPATAGDIACSLTHQGLWRDIAGGEGPAVVLEDDARLSDAFLTLVRSDLDALMRRHGMGVMKIEFWPGPQRSRRFPVGKALGAVSDGIGLFRMRSTFLGTCGYVMTPEAARVMLARFPRLGVPVDHALFGREAGMGFPLLRPGFLNPAPVLHDAEAYGSDIRSERLEITEAPRSLTRRFRDWRVAMSVRREMARGQAERVEMRFAGEV